MPDLAAIRALLETASRLQGWRQVTPQASLAELTSHIQGFLGRKIHQRNDTSPHFNLFQITRRAHYEVTTHSALLGELLNPLGNHDQGGLFLSSFLELIASKKTTW